MTFHTDWQSSSTVRVGAVRPAATGAGKIIAPALFVIGTALTLGTAVVLFGADAQAQTPQPAP